MSEKTIRQIHHFMTRELKRRLRKDQKDYRILKEADLECCTYFHLRRFLGGNSKWRVFARKYTPSKGIYPDLVVCKGKKRKFVAEIKWRRKKISRHDREKLGELGASKKYFITALPDAEEYSRATKKPIENYKLFEVKVGLGFERNKTKRIEEWEKERGEYRKI